MPARLPPAASLLIPAPLPLAASVPRAVPLPPLPVSGPDAQHAARELLRRAEYHRNDPSLLDRLGSWLLDRLDALFSGSPGVNALLVLAVLIGAVVVFALVRAGPPRRTASRSSAIDADPLRPLSATDHRRLAVSLTEQGRSAEALREWLRAAVQLIEERGVLVARPGRTGAATAREAGPLLPSAAAALLAATTAFDEVWFGDRPATPADAELGRAAADAVQAARSPVGAHR